MIWKNGFWFQNSSYFHVKPKHFRRIYIDTSSENWSESARRVKEGSIHKSVWRTGQLVVARQKKTEWAERCKYIPCGTPLRPFDFLLASRNKLTRSSHRLVNWPFVHAPFRIGLFSRASQTRINFPWRYRYFTFTFIIVFLVGVLIKIRSTEIF